jgi:hypothetical protein
MLILPPGHAQAVRERRPIRPHEKWMVGAVMVALAALVVVLAISLGTADKKSGPGCVSVSLAYSTGGDHIYRCGGAARSLCAGAGRAGGITGEPGRAVAAACRKAGLPTGEPGHT